MSRYTYGDSSLAAERLALVARLFDATSSAFVRRAGRSGTAVDLGCGPGHTIEMVARAAGANTMGVERSPAFAALAARAGHRVIVADVRAPLSLRDVDLLYARLLLAHLADPVASVASWARALRPDGRVLIDDLEAIETGEPAFRTYLDEVALAVVRAQGGALFVGPLLHEAADPQGLQRVVDDVASFGPDPADTARVFAMNLAVLVERGEVRRRPELAAELDAIASGERAAEPVRWRVRQIAWERTG